jgi:hypothetical protein
MRGYLYPHRRTMVEAVGLVLIVLLTCVIACLCGCSNQPSEPEKTLAKVKADYDKCGDVQEFARACRELIYKYKENSSVTDDPIPVKGEELGAIWNCIRQSWDVKEINLWYRRMVDGVCLQIALRNSCVSVFVFKKDTVMDEKDRYVMRWANGVYIVCNVRR